MSYDIYGRPLRRGYCEVHPHIGEEYPCELCMMEADRERQRRADAEESRREYENTYYAQQVADAEYQSWFAPDVHSGGIAP